jgi:hypothetical protein
MVNALPIVERKGKKYFVDARLGEMRNIKDPGDVLPYVPIEHQTIGESVMKRLQKRRAYLNSHPKARQAVERRILKLKGWHFESNRHSLAAKGIATGHKTTARATPKAPNLQPFALKHKDVKEGTGETFQYDVLGQFWGDDRGGEEVGKVYQEKEKGRKAEIKWLSPEEYLKLADRVIEEKENTTEEKRYVKDLTQSALRGDKFAMPWLEYDSQMKVTGQEGAHRARMAKELGIAKIPVVVVQTNPKWQDSAEWAKYKREKGIDGYSQVVQKT